MAAKTHITENALLGGREHRPGRPPAMSVLHILDSSGDTPIYWDRERLAAGDPQARAAVEEAERIFAQARARGAQAFRLTKGQPAERLERLDRQAEEILVIPQMVGG